MGVFLRKSRTNLIKSSFSGFTGTPVKTIFILHFSISLYFPLSCLLSDVMCFYALLSSLVICSILPFTCPTFPSLANVSLLSYFLSWDRSGLKGLKFTHVSICLTKKRLVWYITTSLSGFSRFFHYTSVSGKVGSWSSPPCGVDSVPLVSPPVLAFTALWPPWSEASETGDVLGFRLTGQVSGDGRKR